MRDYAKVSPQFWTKGSGKRLRGDPDAQVLALYLVTCPSANMIGIYYVPFVAIAHETGLGEKRAKAAMARLTVAGFADYDDDAELAWVPNMAAYQIGEAISGGDKRHKGVTGELGKYTGHRFAERFLETYGTAYGIVPAASKRAASGSPFQGASGTQEAPPKRKPQIREDQDQDQDQDQEQEQGSRGDAATGRALAADPTLESRVSTRDAVQDAPGTPPAASIEAAPVSEVKPSQVANQAPALPSPEPDQQGKRARAAAGKRALPSDWIPSPACDVSLRAKYHPADIATAIESMRDWALADSVRKADWDATLRGWLRRDAAAGKARPAPASSRLPLLDACVGKPLATPEQIAEAMAWATPDDFAPGSDLALDETEEAS